MSTPDTLLIASALGLRTLRIATLMGLAFLVLLRTRFGQRFRVLDRPRDQGQLASEAWACAQVLAFDAGVAALLWFAVGGSDGLAAMFSGQGWMAALLSFSALFAWYELWFYGLHRALHTRWGWRWHRQHHTAIVRSPLTALSFSLVERAGLLLGLLLFFSLGWAGAPLSGGGVAAYLVLNQVLNIIGHSNVEPAPDRPWAHQMARWWVTPTFHALHHARRRAHFGLFTTLLDRWLETVAPDWAQALATTASGHPLHGTHRAVSATGQAARVGTGLAP